MHGMHFFLITEFCTGGESDANNCQILQSRVNLFKSNKEDLGKEDLEQYSCHLKFTGQYVSLCMPFHDDYISCISC